MPKIDFRYIADRALQLAETLVPQWCPGPTQTKNNELYVLNPTRDDKRLGSFSVNLKTGAWIDRATPGDSGRDLISLYSYIHGVRNFDAAKTLQEQLGLETQPPDTSLDGRVSPVPADAPPLPKTRNVIIDGTWVNYPYTHYWKYTSALGDTHGYTARCSLPDGGKDIVPITLWRVGGVLKWRVKQFPKPRPLYGLHALANSPQAQVIIVEGEKCTEALQGLIDGAGLTGQLVAVSWTGGSKAVHLADWSPLAGRRVVLWPDFDWQADPNTGEIFPNDQQPGYACMLRIGAILTAAGCTLKILAPDESKPNGWDVADAIIDDSWGLEDIIPYIRGRSVELPAELPEVKLYTEPEPHTNLAPVAERPTDPFRCLGYNRGNYYYLPQGTRQIVALKAAEHTKSTLLQLAPLVWWERNYPPSGKSSTPDYGYAMDCLLRTCERIGVYDHRKLRGRGAWYDNGRSVLHLGDRLIVDGRRMEISEFKGRYIYQADASLEHTEADPLTVAEAHRLREITDMLFWESPINSVYFAGWAVIAPICGALKTRPHIWVTGSAGSGKTYVVYSILKPLLGEMCLPAGSETSGAGIRQELETDALPVLFDEFDADKKSEMDRLQGVLAVARAAFSETDAKIFKGRGDGKGIAYQIRSCFCLSSIVVDLARNADETRVVVLGLNKPHDTAEMTVTQHRDLLTSQVSEILTEKYCAGMRARTVRLIPQIRANTETFAAAISETLGSRRAADQIAPLLAGAYSLSSDGEISIEQAREWVASHDCGDQIVQSAAADEYKCLDTILAHVVRMPGMVEISIAALLERCRDVEAEAWGGEARTSENPEEKGDDGALRRCGIRYTAEDRMIWFAGGHQGLRRILAGTPWERGANRVLSRIPGAVSKSSMRMTGYPVPAVGIPWEGVFR